MGEAFMPRGGGAARVYDEVQTLNINLNPTTGTGEAEITVGFTPDLVLMIRTTTSTSSGYVNRAMFLDGPGTTGNWVYGRSSSSANGVESGSTGAYISEMTETGFVLGECSRTIVKFIGDYRIIAIKYA